MTAALAIYALPDAVRDIQEECPRCGSEPDADPCDTCGGDRGVWIRAQLDDVGRQMEIRVAVERLALRMKEHEAEAALIESHTMALAERARRRRSTAAYIRAWIEREMQAGGIENVKTAFATVSLADNPAGVDITDEDSVPDEFRRAHARIPLDKLPADLREYVVSTDVPATPLKAYIEETGHVPAGVAYRKKGERQHLVVRT